MCQDLGHYPFDVNGAQGGLINGMPVVCGGFPHSIYKAKTECFILRQNKWIFFANLTVPRNTREGSFSSVTVNGDRLWITGTSFPFLSTKQFDVIHFT